MKSLMWNRLGLLNVKISKKEQATATSSSKAVAAVDSAVDTLRDAVSTAIAVGVAVVDMVPLQQTPVDILQHQPAAATPIITAASSAHGTSNRVAGGAHDWDPSGSGATQVASTGWGGPWSEPQSWSWQSGWSGRSSGYRDSGYSQQWGSQLQAQSGWIDHTRQEYAAMAVQVQGNETGSTDVGNTGSVATAQAVDTGFVATAQVANTESAAPPLGPSSPVGVQRCPEDELFDDERQKVLQLAEAQHWIPQFRVISEKKPFGAHGSSIGPSLSGPGRSR